MDERKEKHMPSFDGMRIVAQMPIFTVICVSIDHVLQDTVGSMSE